MADRAEGQFAEAAPAAGADDQKVGPVGGTGQGENREFVCQLLL